MNCKFQKLKYGKIILNLFPIKTKTTRNSHKYYESRNCLVLLDKKYPESH